MKETYKDYCLGVSTIYQRHSEFILGFKSIALAYNVGASHVASTNEYQYSECYDTQR